MKTLFLDRDGVINKRIVDAYVTKPEEFLFLPKVKEAIKIFNSYFDYIFIITNQQGINKGLFSHKELKKVHDYMLEEIAQSGGKIDKIYYCADLNSTNSHFRKPEAGMAEKAFLDYPDIDLNKTIMIGDFITDLKFAKNVGIESVYLSNFETIPKEVYLYTNQVYSNLYEYALSLKQKNNI